MREFKFRAWDKESERMFNIARFDFADHTVYSHLFACEGYLAENLEIMQYTGLKDKNSTEIYEGDVVQYLKHKRIYHDYENESAYVEYNESKCRFELNKGKGNNETFCSFSKFGTDDEEVEVIGNIYEHPHLLKE